MCLNPKHFKSGVSSLFMIYMTDAFPECGPECQSMQTMAFAICNAISNGLLLPLCVRTLGSSRSLWLSMVHFPESLSPQVSCPLALLPSCPGAGRQLHPLRHLRFCTEAVAGLRQFHLFRSCHARLQHHVRLYFRFGPPRGDFRLQP
jgi:hypothetical protein